MTTGPAPDAIPPRLLTDLGTLLRQPLPNVVQDKIDDLVYDTAEGDESVDTSGVEDEEGVLEMRGRFASGINNQGLDEQLRYLEAQGLDVAEVAALLVPVAASSHAALSLHAVARS